MGERIAEHFEGMSRRDILEAQEPAVLLGLRGEMLNRLSDLESEIHLVNDVLGGMGADPGDAYDANDGTQGSPEHPEDSVWPGIEIGRE